MPHEHRPLNLSSTVAHYKFQLYWAAIRYGNTKRWLQQKSKVKYTPENTTANVGWNSRENKTFFHTVILHTLSIYTLQAHTKFLTENYHLCRWAKNTKMSENGITYTVRAINCLWIHMQIMLILQKQSILCLEAVWKLFKSVTMSEPHYGKEIMNLVTNAFQIPQSNAARSSLFP